MVTIEFRESISEILDILKKYQKERNLTIIMITHNLENTLYSDRIVVLNEGKIYPTNIKYGNIYRR